MRALRLLDNGEKKSTKIANTHPYRCLLTLCGGHVDLVVLKQWELPFQQT